LIIEVLVEMMVKVSILNLVKYSTRFFKVTTTIEVEEGCILEELIVEIKALNC